MGVELFVFEYEYGYYEEDEARPKSDGTPFSKNDLLAAITALLAGYAAEEVVFNKVHHTIGENMGIIDNILFKMAECGMLGWEFLYRRGHNYEVGYSDAYKERLEAAFLRTVADCYERAKATVIANERLIKKLAPVLVSRESLEKSECEPILFELGGTA